MNIDIIRRNFALEKLQLTLFVGPEMALAKSQTYSKLDSPGFRSTAQHVDLTLHTLTKTV
jgi:hypothetical protein